MVTWLVTLICNLQAFNTTINTIKYVSQCECGYNHTVLHTIREGSHETDGQTHLSGTYAPGLRVGIHIDHPCQTVGLFQDICGSFQSYATQFEVRVNFVARYIAINYLESQLICRSTIKKNDVSHTISTWANATSNCFANVRQSMFTHDCLNCFPVVFL